MSATPIDWEKAGLEALGHFRSLLRIDTTNPPGHEERVAAYLAKVLSRERIPSERVSPAPGRTSLAARLSTGGSGGALLLSAHTDVVAAEAKHWTHPPFAAELVDGFVWGRGALDMKHMLAMSLEVLLLLKRRRVRLARDLRFLAVADEEAACGAGSEWLAEHRRDLLEAEYGLTEVGGFTLHVGGKRLYPIQVAEKGIVWLKMRARGEPGHGSVPHEKNATVLLARGVRRLGKRGLLFHATPPARDFVREIARALGFPAGAVVRGLVVPGLSGWIERVIPDPEQARVFHALLHNTACPTGLEAGQKVNVIPSEAVAVVDGRTLPGQTEASFLEEVRSVVGSGIELEVMKSAPPLVVPQETPLFRTLKEVVEERDPGARAVPYMITGFTDAKYLARAGVKVYGFAPLKLPEGVPFTRLFHGHDERVPVEGFLWGLRTLYEVVERFCRKE